MPASNAQLGRDFAAAYKASHPDEPMPAVEVYRNNRFRVRLGWASLAYSRDELKRETATMFVKAATGGGRP